MESRVLKNLVIFLCVVAVMGTGALLYKNYTDYLQVQNTYDQAKQDLEKLKIDIETTKRLLDKYEKEKQEFSKLLFSERDVPAFLDSISKFAALADVHLTNMKTKYFQQVVVPQNTARALAGTLGNRYRSTNNQQTDPQQDLQRVLTLSAMPIDIQVKGEFAALLKFFNQLEAYKQLLSVSAIEIKSNYNDYPTLSCNFTLKIYSLMTLEELKRK